MRNSTLWIICLIVLAVAGGVLFYSRMQDTGIPNYQAPTKEPPGHGVVGNASVDKDPYDVLITYTTDGFKPADITIPQGARVRFLNKSGGAFWPAVGVHPTHTLYPEKESSDCLGSAFDACQDLAPDEFYDFTFYYEGTWPYHDHLRAYNTGSITVTAASSTK